jgi:hypothetical protein
MSEVREFLEDAVGKRWTRRFTIAFTVIFIYLAFSFFTSLWPFSVAKGVMKKVVNENTIITNYEWYYDQYNAIQAQKANVRVIESMPKSDKQQADLAGTTMVLNGMIADYNSRSKQITRNLWKPSDIPYTINMEGL